MNEYYNSIKQLIDEYVERNQLFEAEIEWANKFRERVEFYYSEIQETDIDSYKALYTKVCVTINNRIIKTKDIIQGTESVLDTAFLAGQIQKTFLSCPLNSLPIKESFNGAGVYAIYYSGDYPLYAPVSLKNIGIDKQMPIYIGKAVMPGTRKNNVSDEDKGSPSLFRRLREHTESILSAGLCINDFTCRYYIVTSKEYWMVSMLETTLIEKFNPIWNKLLDGFGNHDPGSGRVGQKKSYWDTIHPGRKWAEKLQNNKSALEIYQDMIHFYKKN